MKVFPLSPRYNQNGGLTIKCILDYTDVALMTSGSVYSLFTRPLVQGGIPQLASAVTTVALGANPAGLLVKQFYADVVTAFVGTGTLVHIVGDDGDTARFMASVTLKTAAALQPTLKTPYRYTAVNTIDIAITAGTDITTFTAGEVHFYAELFDPVKLPQVNSIRKS